MYAVSTTREVLKGRSQVVRNAPQQAISADDAHQIADPWYVMGEACRRRE